MWTKVLLAARNWLNRLFPHLRSGGWAIACQQLQANSGLAESVDCSLIWYVGSCLIYPFQVFSSLGTLGYSLGFSFHFRVSIFPLSCLIILYIKFFLFQLLCDFDLLTEPCCLSLILEEFWVTWRYPGSVGSEFSWHRDFFILIWLQDHGTPELHTCFLRMFSGFSQLLEIWAQDAENLT